MPHAPLLTAFCRITWLIEQARYVQSGNELALFTTPNSSANRCNLSDGTAATFPEITNALTNGSLDWTIGAGDLAAIPSNAVNLVAHGLESGNQAIYVFAH